MLVILGPKLLAAAPVFQVLAVFGVIQEIIGNAVAVYLAKKKQEYTTINTMVGLLVMGVLIVPFTSIFGLIGAGLAVVKRILRRHGGKIWLSPGVTNGTEFCFSIPRPGRTKRN